MRNTCINVYRPVVPELTSGNGRVRKDIMQRFGTAVAQWLKCCVTNRKVVGSIPDGVSGIFH